MAVDSHAISTAIYHDTTEDIGTNTERRDVSDMLDLWAHKDTPFLNKLTWGAESGGLNIEWISEHLGFGYLAVACEATTASAETIVAASGMSTVARALEQINTGTLLFAYDSTTSEYALLAITSYDVTGSIVYDVVAVTTSTAIDLTTDSRLFIVGTIANEGSAPGADTSRTRDQITNAFAILRKDVQITGSMAATDFHAVSDETSHQIQMRLIEMQRERERLILLSAAQTRSSTVAGLFNGCLGFFVAEAANGWVQDSSMDFTETAVNDLTAEVFENGGNPSILVGSPTQLRKFTTWDRTKIRTSPDAKLGGHYVTRYLTDVGIELEICMLRHYPGNLVYMLDLDKIHPRAKRGRKLIVEKLGKDGDRTKYQMISEFSLEMRGVDKGEHGAWMKLTGGTGSG